jgi:hypothetical protein
LLGIEIVLQEKEILRAPLLKVQKRLLYLKKEIKE